MLNEIQIIENFISKDSCEFLINNFEDTGDLINLFYLYRDYGEKHVYSSNLPDVIKSHLWNVMSASFCNKIKPLKETTLEAAGNSKKAQAAAILNACKWQACQAWCRANNVQFRIVTEKDIFHQGRAK